MDKRMKSQQWIRVWMLTVIIPVLSIGVVNYLVDPLWSFGHHNRFNAEQSGFDERQQKSNRLYFSGMEAYDGILLGSSRSSFINQNDFAPMRIYNYAFNGMQAEEYAGYLEFAKRLKGESLKYVIIGADFANTMLLPKKYAPPESYIARTTAPLYRFKMLFTLDLLERSLDDIKRARSIPLKHYNRDNVKFRRKLPEPLRIKQYRKNMIAHTNYFDRRRYERDPDYFSLLRKIKRENPETRFIVFTSPVSADLFVSIIRNRDAEHEYRQWIRGLVDIFEEIYCFMDVNSVTSDLHNYPDDSHFYPEVGSILATKLQSGNFDTEPADFGTPVNRHNVDAFLESQMRRVTAHRFDAAYPAEQLLQ
jgi:hypothetical protein